MLLHESIKIDIKLSMINNNNNKLIIIFNLRFFHFYIVYKRKLVIKNMIDENFINFLNELNYKINYFYENCYNFHQIKRNYKNNRVFTFFN